MRAKVGSAHRDAGRLGIMCGRYTLKHLPEEILESFESIQDIAIDPPPPSWNIAPTQLAPVIGLREAERVMRAMRWGLIPSWSKDDKIGAKCVNARGETVHEKPAFRAAFARRRCVVPATLRRQRSSGRSHCCGPRWRPWRPL